MSIQTKLKSLGCEATDSDNSDLSVQFETLATEVVDRGKHKCPQLLPAPESDHRRRNEQPGQQIAVSASDRDGYYFEGSVGGGTIMPYIQI